MCFRQPDRFPPSPHVIAILSRRLRLPPPTAALIAELAGIGERDPNGPEPIGQVLAHAAAKASAAERRP